ncbi:hypothetical protein MVEG_12221 [Podila verticillata NRRL 6337]|uniref:Uncharacterized protein n=1 Tax=Podila verticillata NRRL 6337 TaxID=1069443 RepID=A0A086TIW0_9FUNG|nr:hypothetical protein MVEG_12221 [Podila verticillata NRRL 6337]
MAPPSQAHPSSACPASVSSLPGSRRPGVKYLQFFRLDGTDSLIRWGFKEESDHLIRILQPDITCFTAEGQPSRMDARPAHREVEHVDLRGYIQESIAK